MASKILLTAALVAATVTACASESSTGPQSLVTRAAESTTEPPAPDAPPAPDVPPPDTPHADPASFRYEGGGVVGYYFTTPSGLWRCAILADSAQGGADDTMAGCQPHVSQPMTVAGAPLVHDHYNGKSVAPNAILVNPSDHARFASLSQALFWRPTGDAPVLPYGLTLRADGFSCVVAESGVSCRSDASGNGFTFSTHGYEFLGAQPAPAPATVPDAGPTLGRVWGPSQQGYGEVRPVIVYNGGSPSGAVFDIVWRSWGDEQAIGDGTALNTAGGTIVTADAPPDVATIVAFDLGDCDGTWMYRSVVWFFPGDGETFEAHDHREFRLCEENPYGR